MDARDPIDTPVLIAGGGPAGLAAAATLAQHGVASITVEKRSAPNPIPRATALSTRTMELVRAWGLEEQVLLGAADVEWLLWRCETLAQIGDGHGVRVGLPSREQASIISPAAPSCAPQPHLEAVLIAHLESSEHAQILRSTELVSVDVEPAGVVAVVRGPDGREREVRARHLVAADGAYSRIRQALEIELHGPPVAFGGVSGIFDAPLWDVVGEHRYGIYGILHPDADGVFLPAGPGDRWGFGRILPPGADLSIARPERFAEVVRIGAGLPDLPLANLEVGTFTAAAAVAERYRRDSAFLVGDAAHRVTPRGGTGLNTAIYDGYDLGWKLAWVLRGWAGDELLDSYEEERRPVALHNAERSADEDGTPRSAQDELRWDIGGRIPHLWTARGGGAASTLDLLGGGLTLFTGEVGADAWRIAAAAAGDGVPVEVQAVDEISARALGVRPGGALLARPDGVPAGWWASDGAIPALRAAVAEIGCGAGPRLAAAA